MASFLKLTIIKFPIFSHSKNCRSPKSNVFFSVFRKWLKQISISINNNECLLSSIVEKCTQNTMLLDQVQAYTSYDLFITFLLFSLNLFIVHCWQKKSCTYLNCECDQTPLKFEQRHKTTTIDLIEYIFYHLKHQPRNTKYIFFSTQSYFYFLNLVDWN